MKNLEILVAAVKEDLETILEVMLASGISEEKYIYAACNAVARKYNMEIDMVVDAFQMIVTK